MRLLPRRRRSAIAAALLAVAAGSALVLALVGFSGQSRLALNATPIDPPVPSPRIVGTTAEGAPVELPRKGRPMVVTFLFTRCPSVCPLIARQLAAALDEIGPRAAAGIDIVAISVDPAGDTPGRVRAYLRNHALAGRMAYVTGPRRALAEMWTQWDIAAQPSDQPALSLHSARIVLVDQDGQQVGRFAAGLPIPPRDIAADMRSLLGDG